jgi:hypothetical protein
MGLSCHFLEPLVTGFVVRTFDTNPKVITYSQSLVKQCVIGWWAAATNQHCAGLVLHKGSKQNFKQSLLLNFSYAKFLIRNDQKFIAKQYMDKSIVIKN